MEDLIVTAISALFTALLYMGYQKIKKHFEKKEEK